MASKAIIEIPIDDAAFQRFLERYNEYRASLDGQSEAWQKVSAALDAAGGSARGLSEGAVTGKEALALAAAQAGLVSEALSEAVKAQSALGTATEKTGKHFSGLAKTAKEVGHTVATLGGWIIKLGAVGLGVGGIAGGLGIDSLANAAVNRQRSAYSLGLSPGQLASFQVNALQFLGVGALQSAVLAQTDITKAGSLRTLGIDYTHAASIPGTDLAFDELKAARRGYLAAPKGQGLQSPAVQAYLALGGQYGDVLNASRYSESYINQAQTATRRGAGALDFPQQVGNAWATLAKALERAGLSIQTNFINALVKLAPVLAHLSLEVQNAIAAFIDSGTMKAVVDSVKAGLMGLDDFLTHQVNWKQVGDYLNQFGSGLRSVLEMLGILKPSGAPSGGSPGGSPGAGGSNNPVDKGITDWLTSKTPWLDPIRKLVNPAPGQPVPLIDLLLPQHVKPAVAGALRAIQGAGKGIGAIWDAAAKFGADPLLSIATAYHESKLDPKAVGDNGTSFGYFQLHRGGELGNLTREQAFDPKTNAMIAIAEIAAVQKAHPHWSPGQVAAAAQRPADRAAYAKAVNEIYAQLRAELRREQARSPGTASPHPGGGSAPAQRTNRTGAAQKVSVHVYNSTAARVAISANGGAVS